MSSLEKRIKDEMKQAMMAKEKVRLGTLRMLSTKLQYQRIDSGCETLDDKECMKVIQSQMKQRKDSIEQFRAAGREESALAEEAELAILQDYLLGQLTSQELQDAVREARDASGAESPKEMGKIMKHLSANYAGRYDGKEASTLARKIFE